LVCRGKRHSWGKAGEDSGDRSDHKVALSADGRKWGNPKREKKEGAGPRDESTHIQPMKTRKDVWGVGRSERFSLNMEGRTGDGVGGGRCGKKAVQVVKEGFDRPPESYSAAKRGTTHQIAQDLFP